METVYMAGYGQKLRKYRFEREITLRSLSEDTELPPDYLSRIEREVVVAPTAKEILDSINNALGLTAKESEEMLQAARSSQSVREATSDYIPALFRTNTDEKLTEEEIRNLHNYINSGI